MANTTSIRKVAALANVSISTVSAMLNGTKYVSPRLQARIHSAMEQLDYEPKGRGQGRAAEKCVIGVVLPGIYSSFFSPLLNGMTDAGTEFDYGIQLNDSGRNWAQEREQTRALIAQGIDHIILDSVCPTEHEEAYFGELKQSLMRTGGILVALNRELKDDFFRSISVDNYMAAYEATEHLIGLGHRRIAHICGSLVFPHSGIRAKGYRDALLDGGISVDERLIVQGDFSPISGYAAMDEFFNKGLSASALFCANDQMAVGAIKAMRKHGLRVPEDVAVVGFDNLFVSSLIEPNLTTVQYPIYQMGYLAVRLMSDQGSVKTSTSKIKLKARLIVRRSSQPDQIDDWDLQKW